MTLFAPAALLCASLLVAEALRSGAPVPSALGLVALAVVTAVVTTRATWTALLWGAGAAVVYALLRPMAPWAAGAAFVAALLGPRAIRALTRAGTIATFVLASLAGALGAGIVARTLHAGPERLVGALLLVGFFVALPLAVPADDARTGALRSVAARSRGAARVILLRAVALRRRLETALHRPSPPERRALASAFDRLAELGEARASAIAGGDALDAAMRERLAVVVQFARVLDRRAAAHEGLDAAADQRLTARREDAETELEALREL